MPVDGVGGAVAQLQQERHRVEKVHGEQVSVSGHEAHRGSKKQRGGGGEDVCAIRAGHIPAAHQKHVLRKSSGSFLHLQQLLFTWCSFNR